jgi:phosphohistidine phosphatase
MALYLVQHGKSLPKDQDPDPGLTVEGISDVERIAAVAKGYGVRVAVIRHSGKKRAQQTAEIFAAALRPVEGIQVGSGLNPLDEVAPWAGQVRSEEDAMLVGHLPFMERLTSQLVTGSRERLVFKFQNGGIVCLDKSTETPFWFIKWTLLPHIG